MRKAILAAVFAMLALSDPLRAASRPTLPPPSGPYGIGRISYQLTDESRPEPLSPKPDTRRRMMAYIWYPTNEKPSPAKPAAPYAPGLQQVVDKISKGDLRGMFSPGEYSGPESLPETATIENAPVAPGKYPLLLFAHGWGNQAFLYTAELQDIVSHGYIIAAIDHPYDTTYTLFPNGDAVFFAQQRFNTETANQPHGLSAYAKERVEVMALDNRYALTEVLKRFSRSIDAEKIGAFGHSIGGLTAARTCQLDPRVKACMDQDSADYRGSPFVVSDLSETEKQPFFLFVVSSADVWSPSALNPSDADLAQQKLTREQYDAIMKEQQQNQTKQLESIAGGSYRVMLFDLPGFIHRTFSDQTLLASNDRDQNLHNFQVAEDYVLAFFDKYLRGNRKTILDTGQPPDPRAKLEKFPPHAKKP